VDLAHHATIAVLLHWFPDCLDKLQREYSMVTGELPRLILPERNQEADLLSMLLGKKDSTGGSETGEGVEHASRSAVQLGAHQAILVYDEKQRERVQGMVGDAAMVLTVQQCKGLEFQVRRASSI
jgi:hypothetical protein